MNIPQCFKCGKVCKVTKVPYEFYKVRNKKVYCLNCIAVMDHETPEPSNTIRKDVHRNNLPQTIQGLTEKVKK